MSKNNTDNNKNAIDIETTQQRNGARKEALDRIDTIHSKIDALQTRLGRIRARRPGRSARVAGCLWHAIAASRRGGEGGHAPSPKHGRVAVKRSKKLSLEAGLLEDEAERRLWECDEVVSNGDPVIRLHRKALVLRIKRLMKHAARLASGSGLARRLETSLGSVSDAWSSSDEDSRSETKSSSHDDTNAGAEPADADELQESGEEAEQAEKQPSDDARAEKEDADIESPRAMDETDAETDTASFKGWQWKPKFEQFDNHRTGGVTLCARLPGVAQSDLDIVTDARRGTLHVTASSRTHGKADEEFRVGETLDLKRARAQFEDNVLTIDLPPLRRRRREDYAPRRSYGPRFAQQSLFGGLGPSAFWGF